MFFWVQFLARSNASCFFSCREIQAHVAEDFWYIHVSYQAQDGSGCDFQWDRERIFDLGVALVLYEACVEKPQAKVTKVDPLYFERLPTTKCSPKI